MKSLNHGGTQTPSGQQEGEAQGLSPRPHSPLRVSVPPWFRLFSSAAIGALLGMSAFGAVIVVGWVARLVQGRALRAWWGRSPLASEVPFEGFLATLGPEAPSPGPGWFLSDGPGRFAAVANLLAGVRIVGATALLAGWGTVLMAVSWEYGWEASFHKSYEVAMRGRALALAGWGLFAAAMVYVPMAQAHASVTGDFRSFFDFRLVARLIQARLGTYAVLAALFLQIGLIQEGLKSATYYLDGFLPWWTALSDAEALWAYRLYYLGYSAFLIAALLLTRLTAAWVYADALLSCLRRGWVTPERLPPRQRDWLGRLGLLPARPAPAKLRRPLCVVRGWLFQGVGLLALFVTWLAFGAKTYVGEFIHYHPVTGFLNQPLVLLPYADHTPAHLVEAVREGREAR